MQSPDGCLLRAVMRRYCVTANARSLADSRCSLRDLRRSAIRPERKSPTGNPCAEVTGSHPSARACTTRASALASRIRDSKRACCASVNRFESQSAPACAPDDLRASPCPISASASTRPLQITTGKRQRLLSQALSMKVHALWERFAGGSLKRHGRACPGLSRPSTWFGASSARKQPGEAEKPCVCRALQRAARFNTRLVFAAGRRGWPGQARP